ncbi:MAG: hypothetical protein J3K34DRAFT_406413 [Monoraphidium minutum]|nr:MAG: hypothetical protein J3K34DRAFT_406413 [Monoraphidium minutum]
MRPTRAWRFAQIVAARGGAARPCEAGERPPAPYGGRAPLRGGAAPRADARAHAVRPSACAHSGSGRAQFTRGGASCSAAPAAGAPPKKRGRLVWRAPHGRPPRGAAESWGRLGARYQPKARHARRPVGLEGRRGARVRSCVSTKGNRPRAGTPRNPILISHVSCACGGPGRARRKAPGRARARRARGAGATAAAPRGAGA